MPTTRVRLRSMHGHDADGLYVNVSAVLDEDETPVPVDAAMVAVLEGQAVAVPRQDRAAMRVAPSWALYERTGRDAGGVWVFDDTGVRSAPPKVVPRSRQDPGARRESL